MPFRNANPFPAGPSSAGTAAITCSARRVRSANILSARSICAAASVVTRAASDVMVCRFETTGPQVLLETVGDLADARGRGHRKDNRRDLDHRHDEDGDGDDAEQTRSSRVAAPWPAGTGARHRPLSRALRARAAPMNSRVSSPVAGANSNATAAPATAPGHERQQHRAASEARRFLPSYRPRRCSL